MGSRRIALAFARASLRGLLRLAPFVVLLVSYTVAAALIARARGTWDNDLAGDTLYAYFAEQFGGSLVVKINAATVLTVTDGAYTAGLGGIAAAAPTTAATAWSLT